MVVYDVGGLGEIVAAYGAGRVVEAGDVDGLDCGDRRAARRRGRTGRVPVAVLPRARDELTWERAGDSHIALYEELL